MILNPVKLERTVIFIKYIASVAPVIFPLKTLKQNSAAIHQIYKTVLEFFTSDL